MPKKISLALGGGGIKGYAHIGVLRRLILEGYEISAIAGTSAGGIVGSLYAKGYSPDEIEDFIDDFDPRHLFKSQPGDSPALLGLGGLYELLKEKLGDSTFEHLKIPFACTAMDLITGNEIIIETGKLIDAVQATTAIPGLFPYKRIGKHRLVDGGVIDPVPVTISRWLAPDLPLIAVCLTPIQEKWGYSRHMSIPSFVPIPKVIVDRVSNLRVSQAARVLLDSLDIMTNMIAELRLRLEKPDLIIRPEITQYALFDEVEPEHLILRGEEIVVKMRNQIETIFTTSKRIKRWLRPTTPPAVLLSQLLKEDSASLQK